MRLKTDEISKLLIVSLVIAQFFLFNGPYLFIPTIIAVLLFYFLQQPFKCSIFSLLLLWHFLQIYTGTLLYNYLGKDVNADLISHSIAIVLSSIGLIPLTLPLIYVQNKIPNQTRASLTESVKDFSLDKVMRAYIISFFGSLFLSRIAFLFGGLTQIIFWVADVKWVFFSLFGYMCLLRKEKKNIFYLFVALEFISGFYSFFSDFKTVIFFIFVIMISLIDKINVQLFIKTVVIGILLLSFGLIWTNIKTEYRAFLNGGNTNQNVEASSDDALNKIYDLSSESVGSNSLQGNDNVIQFLSRIQYTYFFAKAIDRVPEIIPYQNGQNWLDNLEFTTTPRFLNPDKPTLDQTEKVKKFTGLQLAGKDKGVSFSLGYFAECYIDFGSYGMMLLLLAIGIMYAFFYKYLIFKASGFILFNYCVAAAFFNEFCVYGMDGTYLLGRFFAGAVTFYFLSKFFFPFIVKYFTTEKKI